MDIGQSLWSKLASQIFRSNFYLKKKHKNQSKVPPDLVKFPDPLFWSQAENLSTPVMGLVGDGRWHKSVAR